MDDRRVERGNPVGDTAVAGATALGRLHHAHHLGEERVGGARRCFDRQRACQVERAGPNDRAGRDRARDALPGNQRAVEIRCAALDARVDRDALAGGDEDARAGFDFADLPVFVAAIGAKHDRAPRRQLRQAEHRRARFVAHDVVERAPDEQEEQQRDGGVEIGMMAVRDRLVEAHAVGQRHADGDRHVHVHPAVPERAPGRAVVDTAGENQRGQRDQRRHPVEEVARRALGPGPHRNREQHDVARRETGNRNRPDKLAERPVLAGFLEQMRRIAEAAQRLHNRRDRAVGEAD